VALLRSAAPQLLTTVLRLYRFASRCKSRCFTLHEQEHGRVQKEYVRANWVKVAE
jgi:hypothetical protein